MPGFYLAFDRNGFGDTRDDVTRSTPPGSIVNIPFRSKLLVDSNNIILGCNYHDNYPFLSFADDRFEITIDGLVYDKSPDQLRDILSTIAESVFIKRVDADSIIRDFILDTDGEFAVILVDKDTEAILIFNDRLGRLPVYYSRDKSRMAVSRNPAHIIRINGNRRFDRKAISQYLLFGYHLGNRTVLEDILQLEGGSLLKLDPHSQSHSLKRLFTYNFDEKSTEPLKISSHADNIIDLLNQACEKRVDKNYSNVLALSGGLDSRTVAICLNNIGADFSAMTFMDYYQIVKPDVRFASEIAETLGLDHGVVNLPRASGKDALNLLNIKCGMNFLGVSFSITMLDRIMARKGNKITLFTGDGGDRVLRDTTPVRKLSSLDSLVDYTIRTNCIMHPEIVFSLTEITHEDIRAGLRELFESYEEQDLHMKYLHFIFYERCPKWHFQGEDRNRVLVRHVTPFYASTVFEYCMRLPDSFKKDFRLYREVLKRLSPSVADIPNPEWNFPITSRKLAVYNSARKLYFHMPERLKKIIQRKHCYTKKADVYASDTPAMRCIRSQFKNSPALQDYFSTDDISGKIGRMDKTGFDHFITLTSLMELVDRGASSVEMFAGEEFI